MKAVVYERYGAPDVLRVEDVPIPAPATGQVRVKVAATSVNLSDWEGLRGSPAYARIGGLRLPAHRTLGSDIAGVVDEVGEGVTRFRPGDEVYGDNLAMMGGFAEYALAPESTLALKPVQLTFAEASTIPQAGAIALQGMQSVVGGSRVLINGAGGGSGSFAIQLAKRLGAHVTGVDNATKQDFMRMVGADEVVDYRLDDFTRTAQPYDFILDLVAHRSVFALRRALAPAAPIVRRWVGAALLRVLTVGRVLGAHRSIDGRACCACGSSPLRADGRALRHRGGKDPHRPHVRARGGSRRAGSCRRGTRSGQSGDRPVVTPIETGSNPNPPCPAPPTGSAHDCSFRS